MQSHRCSAATGCGKNASRASKGVDIPGILLCIVNGFCLGEAMMLGDEVEAARIGKKRRTRGGAGAASFG